MFFNMVTFYIRNHPYIAGFFPKGLQEYFPALGPFKIFFAGILLWYAYRIKIKNVVRTFSEPNNCFISSRESFAAMQTMFKMPYNAITHF